MIAGLYAAIFAFMQIFMTFRVIRVRRGEKVSLGDGGHDELLRKMRAHGNFTEIVPLFLVLLLIAELGGGMIWLLHILGLVMIAGRAMHYFGMTTGSGHGKFRVYGMIATIHALIVCSLLCIWLFVVQFIS